MRAHTSVAVELRHAEVAQVLDVALGREDDPAAALLPLEVVDDVLDRALEDVVGEHHADTVAADETLGEAERLRDATRLLLVPVGEPVDAELLAVAEQAQELARVHAAGHEHQLGRCRPGRAPRSRTRPSAGSRAATGACS